MLQIKWENRFRNDRGKTCKVTVDGTDCPIQHQLPVHEERKNYYSYKFHKSGVRYELAVCIQTGDIVWVNGPFPAGKWPDIKIFCRNLIHHLLPGERVETDKGYRGEPCCRLPANFLSRDDLAAKDRARARHETVNGRLKNWGCLTTKFRHSVSCHKLCFVAVAVITQISFECGEGPYFTRY